MRESYGEDLASHLDLEPYADVGNGVGVASARGTDRPAIELRNHLHVSCADPVALWGRQHVRLRSGKWADGTAES